MGKGLIPGLILGLILWTPFSAQADEISDNFSSAIGLQGENALDALAKDLGAIVGAGSFHQGKALGWFPIGFDIGVHVPVVGIKDENIILTDNGTTIDAIWGQAELGLPKRFNLIGRYGTIMDGDMTGIGLRYGIVNPPLPNMPGFSLTGLYSKVDHPLFDLNTISVNLSMSFDVPFFAPYIGAGYDKSKLKSGSTVFDGEAEGYRAEGGVNVSPLPFTYVTLGLGLANGEKLYHLGAGTKF